MTTKLTWASLLLVAGACGEPVSPNEVHPDLGIRRFDGEVPDSLRGSPSAHSYIVVFRSSVSDPTALTNEIIRIHGGQVHHRYQAALKGFAGSLPDHAIEGIRRNPNVELVELDGIATVSENQRRPPSWGLDRIDSRDLPLDGEYEYVAGGAGVRVYVIDTGVETGHSEFGGRASSGWDFVENDATANDCYNHGTHVAGTIAGTSVGVAKQASIVAVRVIDCVGNGPYSRVIAGVDWVVANHTKPAVVNMSLGGGFSSALNLAVENAINAGMTVVVSAGNSGADACGQSPAAVSKAITVGAITDTDTRASYSNFGSCLDIFAPGTHINSSLVGGVIGYRSGTSMASPHVAGVAALYLAANPAASPSTVTDAITAGATTNRVINPGVGSPNRLLYSLIDASAPPPPPTPPTASFTVACTELTCAFWDQSSDADGAIAAWQWDLGDGSTDSTQNPSHSYPVAGTFRVTLRVLDNTGRVDSASRDVIVSEAPTSNAPPSANFSAGCLRLACDFTDASQDPDGNITQWEWSFGDGVTQVHETGTSLSHTFSEGAIYRVTLTVVDNAGASSTSSRDIAVGLVLSGVGYKVKGKQVVDLKWTGAETSQVAISLNGVPLATVDNTGSFTYKPSTRGQIAGYRFRICEVGLNPVCSKELQLGM